MPVAPVPPEITTRDATTQTSTTRDAATQTMTKGTSDASSNTSQQPAATRTGNSDTATQTATNLPEALSMSVKAFASQWAKAGDRGSYHSPYPAALEEPSTTATSSALQSSERPAPDSQSFPAATEAPSTTATSAAPKGSKSPVPDSQSYPAASEESSTPATSSAPQGSKRPAPDSRSTSPPGTFKKPKHTYLLTSVDFPKDWLRNKESVSQPIYGLRPGENNMQLLYNVGDMFKAPPGTLLIHACNSVGKWGAGIALEFKKRYPEAYQIYHNYCDIYKPARFQKSILPGTALLISPMDAPGHWIGCLFTSERVGKAKDTTDVILKNTTSAIQHLLQLIHHLDEEAPPGQSSEIGDMRMCKINSGMFGVKWADTEAAIEKLSRLPFWRKAIGVWVRPGEEERDVVYRVQQTYEEVGPVVQNKPEVQAKPVAEPQPYVEEDDDYFSSGEEWFKDF
ncbi:hypothetical protein NX059_000919 [Plenodomus lindquistii]|nr:hypothetical protein NX059_000919 [Plenodomus lindquistii]